MNHEELIEILKEFEKKRVLELPDNAQKLFYAIMSIADERDKFKLENDFLRKRENKLQMIEQMFKNKPVNLIDLAALVKGEVNE